MNPLRRIEMTRVCNYAESKMGKAQTDEILDKLNTRVWSKSRKILVPGYYALRSITGEYHIKYLEICALPSFYKMSMGPLANKETTL